MTSLNFKLYLCVFRFTQVEHFDLREFWTFQLTLHGSINNTNICSKESKNTANKYYINYSKYQWRNNNHNHNVINGSTYQMMYEKILCSDTLMQVGLPYIWLDEPQSTNWYIESSTSNICCFFLLCFSFLGSPIRKGSYFYHHLFDSPQKQIKVSTPFL